MRTLLKYEWFYFKRTSKIIILLVLGVFLSGLSVLTARYLNEIIAFALAQEEGINIEIPPSTVLDSYLQFFNNFQQIYFLVVVFIAISFFNQEATRGYQSWLFSRPIKRSHYLLNKLFMMFALVFSTLVISSIVFAFYTYIVFETFSVSSFIFAFTVFLVFIIFYLAFMLLLCVIFRRNTLPMVISVFLFFIFSGLAAITWNFFKYLPSQLLIMPIQIVQGTHDLNTVLITCGITLTVSFIMVLFSLHIFNKKQLT